MSSGVIFVWKPPRASILAYASREPRRDCTALTLAVNAMSIHGFASIAMSSSMPERSCSLDVFRQFAGEEVADDHSDLWSLAFQREMTRIEQMDLGIRIVPRERL